MSWRSPKRTKRASACRWLPALVCVVLLAVTGIAQAAHVHGNDAARQPLTAKSAAPCLLCLGTHAPRATAPAFVAADAAPVALEVVVADTGSKSHLSVFAFYIRPPPIA